MGTFCLSRQRDGHERPDGSSEERRRVARELVDGNVRADANGHEAHPGPQLLAAGRGQLYWQLEHIATKCQRVTGLERASDHTVRYGRPRKVR